MMGRKLTQYSLGAQPGGIQPVKSIFRNSVDTSDSLSYDLMVCETRRTRASYERGPGDIDDGRSSESVQIMPFYYGKRSASICFVLGPKKTSSCSSEYASGFFEPAALHLPATPVPRNEGLLGQIPSPIAH